MMNNANIQTQIVNEKNQLIIKEIDGNLFECPSTSAMAHCVSSDLRMGKGIAVQFKNKFGRVGELHDQYVKPGGVAILKDKDRYIYYLVTKNAVYERPTYQILSDSLQAMRNHMVAHKICKLSIPKIGCGIDGLEWPKVKDLLNETFGNDNVEITVYTFIPQKLNTK